MADEKSPWQVMGISEAEYRARQAGGGTGAGPVRVGNDALPPLTNYQLVDLGGKLQIKPEGAKSFVPLDEKFLKARDVQFRPEDIAKFDLAGRGIVQPPPAPVAPPVEQPPPKPQAFVGGGPEQQIYQALGGGDPQSALLAALLGRG